MFALFVSENCAVEFLCWLTDTVLPERYTVTREIK